MIDLKNKNAALYIRVSTEEQALHGYSLAAQKDTLTEYATANEMNIVNYYIDDGYSARKKFTTRKKFMEMLHDVEAGLIDIIIFIKLDRWFRSVSDYYKVQEILDKHNVVWKTVLEQHETITSSGIFNVNIRLSMAQDESHRTSERIKYVFKSKIAKGEVVSGSTPVGFKIENKKLVIDDDTVYIPLAIFKHFEDTNSKRAVLTHMRDNLNINYCYATVVNILKNPLYKGFYKEYANYCPAIIDPLRFDKLQLLGKKNIRTSTSNNNYIFSGLLTCAECAHNLSGFPAVNSYKKKFFYYRCAHNLNRKLCSSNKTLSEVKLEATVIDYINNSIYSNNNNSESNARQTIIANNSYSVKKLESKLERLKDLYVNNFINLDEYKKDFNKYSSELNELICINDNGNNNTTINKDHHIFKDENWVDIYNALTKEKKCLFWRDIISNIKVYNVNKIEIEFL